MGLEFIHHKNEAFANVFFINAQTLKDKVDLGALLSRYSRTHKSAKQIYEEEFLTDSERGADFYKRVFGQYGDESIAELVPNGFAVCLENIPALWSTHLLHYRLLSAIEKSTRYMHTLNYWDPDVLPTSYRTKCDKRMKQFESIYQHAYNQLAHKYDNELMYTMANGASCKPMLNAIRSKALDYARFKLPVSVHTSLGIMANLRSWLNILSKLTSIHGHSLFYKYVLAPLTDLFKEYFPTIFSKFDSLVDAEDVIRYDREVYHYNLQQEREKWKPAAFEIVEANSIYFIKSRRQIFDFVRAKKHKPHKMFESLDFSITIPNLDYATFRDLQRHRFFSIYLFNDRFPHRRSEWEILSAPMATTLNLVVKANLREWVHAVELRTQPQGHFKYRKLFQGCGKLIADYIGISKEKLFPFANWQSDQEVQLGRVASEFKYMGIMR